MPKFRQLVTVGILMQVIIAIIFTAGQVENWNMKNAQGSNIHSFLLIAGHAILFCFAAKYLSFKRLLYLSFILGFSLLIPFYIYIAINNPNPLADIFIIMLYFVYSILISILFASVSVIFWLLKKYLFEKFLRK